MQQSMSDSNSHLDEPLEFNKYEFVALGFWELIKNEFDRAMSTDDQLGLRFLQLFRDGIFLNDVRNLSNPICHTLRTAPAAFQFKMLQIDDSGMDLDIQRVLKQTSYAYTCNKIRYYGELLKRFYIQIHTKFALKASSSTSDGGCILDDCEIDEFFAYIDTIVGDVLGVIVQSIDIEPSRYLAPEIEC